MATRAKRRPVGEQYRLRQKADGKWECSHRDLTGVSSEGATATEALAGMEVVMADYRQFQDHLHGRCDPSGCERCTKGIITRGILKGRDS